MSVLASIQQHLAAAFPGDAVQVVDESGAHAGHEGIVNHPGDVSHVAIAIVSDRFAGVSRVERQRLVYAAMGETVRKVHAITSLRTWTKEEYGKLPKTVG